MSKHKNKLTKNEINNDFIRKQVKIVLNEKLEVGNFSEHLFFGTLSPQIKKVWPTLSDKLKKSIIAAAQQDQNRRVPVDGESSLLFALMSAPRKDEKELEEGFLDGVGDWVDAGKGFLKARGKEILHYYRNPSDAAKDLKDFWRGAGRQTLNSSRNAIRWAKKKFYSNDAQMSIANIESSDSDVEFIKHFFALFGELTFEKGKFSSIYPNSLEIENPDNYSMYPSMTDDINEWFLKNRTNFIKKIQQKSEQNDLLEVCYDYYEDFADEFEKSKARFSFFGLGSKEIVVDSTEAKKVIDEIVKNQEWATSNYELQISGEQPCIIDVFPMFFRFLYELDMRVRSDFSRKKFLRVGQRLLKQKSASEFIENEKDYLFLRLLRKNSSFRKKWTGYCLNSAFDPDGKWPLSWWTKNGDAFKEKSQDSKARFYGKVFAKIGGTITRDALALKAAQKFYQRAKGVSLTGFWSTTIMVVIFGIDMMVSYDPFEWFSNRDDIEEELIKMREALDKLIDSIDRKSLSKTKLEGIKEKFSASSVSISKMIYSSMIKGLHKNIEDPNQDMTTKKMLMFLLSDNITAIKQISTSFELDESVDLDANNLKFIKSQVDKFILEIKRDEKKSDSAPGAEAALDKIKPSLSQGIKGAENLFESNLILENSFESSFEKFNQKFKNFFNFEIKGDGSDLESARMIQSKFQSSTNAGSKMSEIMSNPEDSIVNSSARFERWWDREVAGKDVKIEPKNTSEKTFYHVAWARGGNGLCSEIFKNNLFTINTSRSWQAWAGIGPSHGLANTFFFYIPYRGGPTKEYVLRSKVEIEGKKVFPINVGSKIQTIDSIIKKEYLKITKSFVKKEHSEVVMFINSLSEKVNTLPDSKETNKFRAAIILSNLYKKRFLEGESSVLSQLKQIVSLDRQLSIRMLEKSNEMANLAPSQQNGAMHGALMSDLRKCAGLKIMLFEALMSGIS